MYVWIEDDKLLEKYNTVWDKVIAVITKMVLSLSRIEHF